MADHALVNKTKAMWPFRILHGCLGLLLLGSVAAADDPPMKGRWPSFRGSNASGLADGPVEAAKWNGTKRENIAWKTRIPGLGHSCPVIWDRRIYLTTAISDDAKAELASGKQGGSGKSAADLSKHSWRVYCLDLPTGKILWERTAYEGNPKIKRHPKSTQANATPATDGKHLVVWFASEGLYCYDLAGKLLWKKDLGVIDAGAFDNTSLQWGAASSPIIYKNMIFLQCDQVKGAFLAAFDIETGKEIWRDKREELASWSTPLIYEGKTRVELVTSSPKFSRGHDPLTGKELWRLGTHSNITVPTPIASKDLIYLVDGYSRPGPRPIYAVRPGSSGDITLPKEKESSNSIAWSALRGGAYVPTPILVGDYLYVLKNIGALTCYEAGSGKQIYEQRLTGIFSASPIAAGGKLYFASEEGDVHVVKAGPRFELLATNPVGEPCFATPAIADGMLVIRGASSVIAIGAAQPNKEARDAAIRAEWERRNGTWQPASAIIDGKERPSPKERKMILEYKDERYSDKVGDKVVGEGISRIDPTQNPKTLDIIPDRAGKQGKGALAIYELNGDELRVCLARPGQARPTEFASTPGSGHILLTFKRLKAAGVK
jgi:uncharacterized protein (TIGR03067 family)